MKNDAKTLYVYKRVYMLSFAMTKSEGDAPDSITFYPH